MLYTFSDLIRHLDYFQFVAISGQHEVVILAQISLYTSLMISLAYIPRINGPEGNGPLSSSLIVSMETFALPSHRKRVAMKRVI